MSKKGVISRAREPGFETIWPESYQTLDFAIVSGFPIRKTEGTPGFQAERNLTHWLNDGYVGLGHVPVA